MASRRSSKRSTRKSTTSSRRGPRGARGKPASTGMMLVIGGLALAAVGGGVYYYGKHKATPALPPGPPPAPPNTLPQTGDVYGSLTTAQQAAVNNALYAVMAQNPSPCPTVDTSGINSAGDLSYVNNRSAAVDCYQTAANIKTGGSLGGGGVGVLDLATYRALMGV